MKMEICRDLTCERMVVPLKEIVKSRKIITSGKEIIF